MKYPKQHTITHTHEEQVQISFTLDADLLWFQGHFPERKIFPGVAQLDVVMHYITLYFNKNYALKSIDLVKFQKPLFPEDALILTLKIDRSQHKCQFEYQCHQRIVSSGRVSLDLTPA